MKNITKKYVLDNVNIHMFSKKEIEFEKFPRMDFLDLVGLFCFSDDSMEVIVTPDLMTELEITDEVLKLAAIRNLEREKYSVKTMYMELGIEPEDSFHEFVLKSIWVIRRKDDKPFGAAGIFKLDLLDRLAQKTRGDLYIVPSSKHELLVAPKALFNGSSAMRIIVASLNKDTAVVDPADVLTNSVYYYDRKKRKVTYA